MRVVVYHDYYGCDTGCCGHIIEMGDESKFDFIHPGLMENHLEFAKRLVEDTFGAEHVDDLDWENCIIVDD